MRSETLFYDERDARAGALAGQLVAVIGYGNLGRSVALNLRDSGVEVLVGNIEDDYAQSARDDGMDVLPVPDAVASADVAFILLPDEVIPDVFERDVAPRLRPGGAVCFASGYVLAYGLVEVPPRTDALLLAPRMVGENVRSSFLDGSGFMSYLNVERDVSGTALDRLLGLALAIGSLRRGAIALTAQQEATLDLFIEQSVGSYLGTAFQLAFRIGVEAGLPAEALVCELYMSGEMSSTIATMARLGFYESVRSHGLVATYGGFLGTLGIDHASLEGHFRELLEQIRSGGFAKSLQEQEASGYPVLDAIDTVIASGNPLSEAEQRVRDALSPQARPAATPGAAILGPD